MHSNKTSRHALRSNILRSRRAGESTIIANLILFIGVMSMASATVFVFKNMMDQSAVAASEEKDRTVSVMRTSFTIPSAVYNPSLQEVTVYVKNTGRQAFYPEDLDIYIDGIRIPRDISDRTVTITPDSDLIDTGVWNTGEDLEFTVFRNYPTPATHTVTVHAPNGVRAESVFSS